MRELEEQQREEYEQTLELLRRPGLGRDAITLLAIRLVQLRHPDMEVELISDSEIRIADAEGASGSVYLHNLWIECERTPEERAELVERYVRILAPTAAEESGQPKGQITDIVALIRDETYRNFVREDDRDLITRMLVGDLWVVYALDLPDSMNVLSKERAVAWGLSAERLLETGVNNLKSLLGEIYFSPYGECFTIGCELIFYASSTLLLDYVWEQAKSLVAGEVVVAVPARDTVLFTGAANACGLEEIRAEARCVATKGHHVVSQTLLRRVEGKWELFL